MRRKMNKRGVFYDWLDLVLLMIVTFFIFYFMFMAQSFSKEIVDNHITEMSDEITTNQELINFLRVKLVEVVPEIDKFPEETRDMTFAEFFTWYDYIKSHDQGFDERNLENLRKGLEAVFDPSYEYWNLQIKCFFTDSQYVDRFDYKKYQDSRAIFMLQLPSNSCNRLVAMFFT